MKAITLTLITLAILAAIYLNSCGSSIDPCQDYYQTACQKINSCNSAITYQSCYDSTYPVHTKTAQQCTSLKPGLLTVDCNTLVCAFATINSSYAPYCQ